MSPTALPADSKPGQPGGPPATPGHGQIAGAALADRINAALPQTQCTRCGYPDCRGYAEAIASGAAAINRCPPGGAEGIRRLAALTGSGAVLPLDPSCGPEAPRLLAVIDEALCIGCALCIKACPVDCIAGAPKRMHTVIDDQCTGCELCVPACPVDCISLVPVTDPRTGWSAWSHEQADAARQRYQDRAARAQRLHSETTARMAGKRLAQPALPDPKSALLDAALQRARDRTQTRTRTDRTQPGTQARSTDKPESSPR